MRGALLLIGLAASAAAAASPFDTTWVQRGFPIANTSLLELAPRVIADPAGGFLATWQTSSTGYPAGDSIWLQRFDRNAEPLWPPLVFLGTSSERSAVIEGDGRGGAFLLYSGFGLFVQHVRGDGRVAPGWAPTGIELAEDPMPSRMARMCSDDSGGVIVCWLEPPSMYVGGGADLRAQRVDALGRSCWGEYGIPVPGGPSPRIGSAIVPDGAGGAILGWDDGCLGELYPGACQPRRIHAQRIDPAGSPMWGVDGRIVCDALPGSRGGTCLVSDGTGGAIFGWTDSRDAATGPDLYAQRIDHNGSGMWASGGVPVCTAGSVQDRLTMVADGAGGASFAWIDWRDFDLSTDPFEVFVHRLDTGGNAWPGWTTNGVRAGFTPAWVAPNLVADESGGTVITWADATLYAAAGFALGRQAFVQRLTPGGAIAPGWPDGGISVSIDDSVKVDPSAALLGDGDVLVAWRDSRHGQPFSDIYATRIGARGLFEPAVAVVSARATYTEAVLEWNVRQGAGIAARLERRPSGGSWSLVANLASEEDGRLTYRDHDLAPDQSYEYRLGMFASAEESFHGETSIRTLAPPPLALSIAPPLPSRGALTAIADLPSPNPARLGLFDLQGRRLWSGELRSGVGIHRIAVAPQEGLRPGIYLVRLEQAGLTARARAVVIH